MDNARKLHEGKCYFLMSYYDRELRVPEVSTYVYIGKNVLPKSPGESDRWYFQEGQSWVDSGPFNPVTRAESERLLTADEDSIDDFLDVDQLLEELRSFSKGAR